mgnify:CR=1 FL=1
MHPSRSLLQVSRHTCRHVSFSRALPMPATEKSDWLHTPPSQHRVRDFSNMMLPYFISSDALESFDLLLSYSTVISALYITIYRTNNTPSFNHTLIQRLSQISVEGKHPQHKHDASPILPCYISFLLSRHSPQ